MTDTVAWKKTIGVIIPSTNTIVEQDMYSIGPQGIGFHSARMYIRSPELSTDSNIETLLEQARQSIAIAVRDILTAEPDSLMMGMSADTFWGGVRGNEEFIRRIDKVTGGLPISTGASACRAALEALGIRRLAVITPYPSIVNEQVALYLKEAGFDVLRLVTLRCPTATSIARVPLDELIRVLRDLDGPDVEGIVQVGTNLPFLQVADEAERWLGKPVVAINAATLWHRLRAEGIDDRFHGFGRLLRDF